MAVWPPGRRLALTPADDGSSDGHMREAQSCVVMPALGGSMDSRLSSSRSAKTSRRA